MDKYKLLGCKYFIDEAKNATDDELILMHIKRENKYAKSELMARGLYNKYF